MDRKQAACSIRECPEMGYLEDEDLPAGWWLIADRPFCHAHHGAVQRALKERNFVIEVVPSNHRRILRAQNEDDVQAFLATICK